MPLDSQVETATSTPGQMSALDYNLGGYGGGFNSPSNNTIDLTTTDLSQLGTGDLFGGQQQYGSSTPTTDFSNVGGGDLSSVGSATGIPPVDTGQGITDSSLAPGTQGSSGGSWWQNLLSGVGSTLSGVGGKLAGLGPYAAVAGLGMSQAKATQKQNEARAKQLADLGGPYTAAGQALLKQFQSGQLRPDQAVVSQTAQAYGDTLIASGTGLSQIAQDAYKNYQSGKLPPADEQRLADQTASQKQQLRARLGNITDSSILAGYDQQIENQANINRQDLLDKRFATGNQAYDEWLKSTTEGQQLKLQGQEFASKSLDNMLNQSLSLSAEGMAPVSQSIQLAMQSDAQLSQQMSELLGNLAAAYAYTRSGPGSGTGGGGSGGGGVGGGVGGGGAGGGLGSSLVKAGESSLMKAIGGQVMDYAAGGGIAASAGSAVAGLGADLAASTAASEAGVAADVAASNLAALGGSSAAGGAAAAGGGEAAAAGADAAGGSAGSGLGSALATAGPWAAAAAAIAGPFYGLAQGNNELEVRPSDLAKYKQGLAGGTSNPQYFNTIGEMSGLYKLGYMTDGQLQSLGLSKNDLMLEQPGTAELIATHGQGGGQAAGKAGKN